MSAAAAERDDADTGAFFRPGPELEPIVARVLRMPEHRHLVEGDARIHWLMRSEAKVKGGRQVLGSCHRPQVTGELRSLFDWMLERLLGETPDYLVILDAQYWAEASPLEREILVYHELCHAVQAEDANGAPRFNQQTGEPVWALRGHDLEEFNAVVARYGTHAADVAAFIEAARQGDAAAAADNVRRIR